MNGTDIVILLLLAVIVGLIIRSMVRGKKKSGTSGCGGGCSSCTMSGMCNYHNDADTNDKN